MAPAASCLCYMCCSMLITLSNKMLNTNVGIDVPKQPYTLAVIAFQSLIAAVVTILLNRMAGIGDRIDFRPNVMVSAVPANLFFSGMLYTGFLCLAYNGVHMVTLFKNVTNIFTVLGEWACFGSRVSTGVIASLFLMGTGAFLSAVNDLEFSVRGYSWMLLNCLSTSAYILYLRFLSKSESLKVSKMEMVLYNNLLTFAIL